MRVLLIENDDGVAQSIEPVLKSENLRVHRADPGKEGIDFATLVEFDIILLHLDLPDMSGFGVLQTLRAAKIKTPMLTVFGFAAVEQKMKQLGLGHSDYILNPVNKDELIARLHAVVQRARRPAQPIIAVGGLSVDLERKSVAVDGVRVHLTGKEYQMLELLVLRRGTTLTKEMLLNHLYGGMDEPELKIIDVFICKLRKKLASASHGRNYIETVWGRGYLLRNPADDSAKMSA